MVGVALKVVQCVYQKFHYKSEYWVPLFNCTTDEVTPAMADGLTSQFYRFFRVLSGLSLLTIFCGIRCTVFSDYILFTALQLCKRGIMISNCLSVLLSVYLSNACTVTKLKHLAKKAQLWLIGSRLRAFQWAEDEHRTLPLPPPKKGGLKSANLNNNLQ